MTQVKIFVSIFAETLEQDVNNWLFIHPDVEITGIKYDISGTSKSALIIYREELDV